MTTCIVTAKDYRLHFKRGALIPVPVPAWNGTERRVGVADRRCVGHERRWEQASGRRFRLRDRRTRHG